MTAPCMIRSLGVALVGSIEIGSGEERHPIRESKCHCRPIEIVHRIAQRAQQIAMVDELIVMRVPAAERREEYLTLQPQVRLGVNEPEDHMQLARHSSQAAIRVP